MAPRDHARAILEAVASQPLPMGSVPLTDEYLRAVHRVERLPGNRNGTDKTWVLRLVEEATRMRRTATRLR